jgi:hypothetical protein
MDFTEGEIGAFKFRLIAFVDSGPLIAGFPGNRIKTGKAFN